MADIDMTTIILTLSAILISASFHELMHGLVAYKLGDDLAHSQGRISLNPLRHIDPFLTVVLPLIFLLLGQAPILAAKPVPINASRLKGGDVGMAVVGLAGPFTNLLLAAVTAIPLNLMTFQPGLGYEALVIFFGVNISLFVFNLLPIPPLDGSRALYAVAPRALQSIMEQIEAYGLMFVILLVSIGGPFLGPVLDTAQEAVINLLIR